MLIASLDCLAQSFLSRCISLLISSLLSFLMVRVGMCDMCIPEWTYDCRTERSYEVPCRCVITKTPTTAVIFFEQIFYHFFSKEYHKHFEAHVVTFPEVYSLIFNHTEDKAADLASWLKFFSFPLSALILIITSPVTIFSKEEFHVKVIFSYE